MACKRINSLPVLTKTTKTPPGNMMLREADGCNRITDGKRVQQEGLFEIHHLGKQKVLTTKDE